jgi:hypothetical protein
MQKKKYIIITEHTVMRAEGFVLWEEPATSRIRS